MLDTLMNWDARMIPTIASFIGWFIILLISALSSRTKLQVLVDVGVLTLKSEQKKVTANMVTLEFGKTPKVTAPDGTYPVPALRLEVKYPAAKTQDNRGLVPLTLETGKLCGYTQTLSKMNNGIQRSPSRRANLAMSSPSCQTMTILRQLPSVILKEKSTLA